MISVDLFCGCGGLSAGAQAAGFEIIAGVDVERNHMITFTYNFPDAESFRLDLSTTDPFSFAEELGLHPGELDLLIGGPPCQGFSKNVPRKNRCLDSSNNRMVHIFLDYCEVLKPRIVLMENVAEMKNGFDRVYSDEVTQRLEGQGYCVSHSVLNAADYGVPQRRRRAFFLAYREGSYLSFPQRTHLEHICVWDAIGDLPSIKHGEGSNFSSYACDSFSDYQRLMRKGKITVSDHIAKRLNPLQYERLAALEPGQGLKDLPKHLQVKGGYSGAYGRLTKDMIAPTITRWVFHPGSGRWGHPEDIRLITIREAARLQGFEDSFEFVGSYVQKSAQLGNAVPPLLAKCVLEHAVSQIR